MSQFQPNSEFHGVILPVPDGVRPQWSVVIPTHNCADYLRETLASVLEQDPGEQVMEIIVVDDHSTKDNPAKVVEELGAERIRFIRQDTNVGKARNYETGIAASRGRLIHQLHGDDRVLPDFYQSTQDCFERFPDVSAVFCESDYIDKDGNVTGTTGKESDQTEPLNGWLAKLIVSQRIQTPSIVLRRDVYEALGAFDRRLSCYEDWEMWLRVATQYTFAFNAEGKAQYRVYGQNTSSQSAISGVRARILREMLQIVDAYLPEDLVAEYKPARSRAMAEYLVRCLPMAVQRKSMDGWLRLCRSILSFDRSPKTLYHMIHFSLRYRKYAK